MTAIEQEPSLRQAADELQRYLSDEIPPMMAVEHFEALVPHPPELTAEIIAQWIGSQRGTPSAGVTTADLIFHALSKLSLLSELELVRQTTMMRAIHEVSRALLQVCPEADRGDLRMRLSHLGETRTVLTSRSEFLHREAGAETGPRPAGPAGPAATAAPAGPATANAGAAAPASHPKPDDETIGRGAHALSLLLSGLAKLRNPKTPPKTDGTEAAVLAQVLSTAALESKTNEDLARHLEHVQREGVATPMAKVFRALGWSLPGWGMLGDEGRAADPRTGRQLAAMDRIVALAPDAQERAKRWGEMIYAAIEQLNEGRLAQAVSILQVAKQLIAERNPDGGIVKQVLTQAEAAISDDLLRRLADNPAKHGLLRSVLDFFPSLRPTALLTQLDGEIRREKRKLILMLLECHGPSCRDEVITRLASGMRGEYADDLGFYRRNLACLLRRIPRTGHLRLEEEIDLLAAMIASGEPMMSAKEAVGALGQLRHNTAESALIGRLRRLEVEMSSRGGNAEQWEMADRLCAALARHGTPRAIRAVAAHACNQAPALGDALSRFQELSRLDLTVDPEQLGMLLTSIRALAPSKVLGFVAKRVHHELSCLMQAIAGTPLPEVRRTLELITEKFKTHPLGDQARKILAKLEPSAAKTSDALTGDLELFGLPSVLQSLAGSSSSGELVLFDAHQTRQGSIVIATGRIARCEAGRIEGVEAVYSFMEKPFPGTFVFRSVTDDGGPAAASALDLMSVIMEGARRHDEYQQAKAFAADGVRFEPTGTPAVRPEGETDGALASGVWDRAAAGQPANECELEMKTDPFRVRRLYAYWVETGALRPRT
jgi:Domain of unknown function (DUF4388)